tara:strand:+ start:423 stop:914 length:492 start_codon:yes stop_codon:yes gene_type:complete
VVVQDGFVSVSCEKVLQIPFGVAIETGAQNLHGITNQMCQWKGVDAVAALSLLHTLMRDIRQRGGICVAHNALFDVRAFNFTMEMFRCPKRLNKEDFFDTLASSRQFSPLRTVNDRRKPFRLEELYLYLCGSEPSWAGLHGALDDTRVTAVCYALGRARNWWR